ncbi:MAG: bifunctional nuclease family protein [Bacteroidaceae bacterium]|nr:bifunctional nuclease family protein [Bacteroidaceae bacterium]
MTRLYFLDANTIAGADDLGVILLIDRESRRGISIVCERRMVEHIKQRQMEGVDTARQLPEVLWTVIRRRDDTTYRILFSNMQDEQYVVFLYDETHSTAYALRASDAVLLALVSDIPIYIEDNLFRRQSIALQENGQSVRIPLNSLPLHMLEEALQQAIDDEAFEQASRLRDEIRRRNADATTTETQQQ